MPGTEVRILEALRPGAARVLVDGERGIMR